MDVERGKLAKIVTRTSTVASIVNLNRATMVAKRVHFLPARRYASAGISCVPVSVCLYLSVSVTSRCSIETDGRIDLVFGMMSSFDQSYAVFKEVQVFTKIRVLPSRTFI